MHFSLKFEHKLGIILGIQDTFQIEHFVSTSYNDIKCCKLRNSLSSLIITMHCIPINAIVSGHRIKY